MESNRSQGGADDAGRSIQLIQRPFGRIHAYFPGWGDLVYTEDKDGNIISGSPKFAAIRSGISLEQWRQEKEL